MGAILKCGLIAGYTQKNTTLSTFTIIHFQFATSKSSILFENLPPATLTQWDFEAVRLTVIRFMSNLRKKENMIQDSPQNTANEKELFHGTGADFVDAICKQNFDWRLYGKHGKKYGEGSYFAVKASYSHRFTKKDGDCDHNFMFMARVSVGLYIEGKSTYRRPPPKDPLTPASDLYDSCVDNMDTPTIFVVFDMDQYYPEYVIKYLTL